MFDYPSSPVNGQTVTGPQGQTYQWDGTKWASYGAGTAYAPLNAPTFTGDARAVTPAYADNDTSIATTAFVQGAVAPNANNTGRNLVMNGAFAIQQRGAGSWTASGYTADRWVQYVNVSTVSTNINALNDANRTAIGDENARYSLTSAFTGTAGAADAVFFYHPIEGARRLSGKTVTLSFWAATASGTVKLGASIDLIPGTGGSPSANVLGNGQIVTVTAAYTRYSLTFSVPSSVGLTLGTNGNDSTNLNLWLTTGANFNTRSGNVGVQSGTVNIYGVQLEIGSVATPFDAGGTPQQILAQCQRFYQVGYFDLGGYHNASNPLNVGIPLRVDMRATPTVTTSETTLSNASGLAVTAWSGYHLSVGFVVVATGGARAYGSFTASADL